MRLHRIALRNLNSLYDDQVVDIDRDLSGASLFLVQGPTGSGKSTLMDAVSLALFGETPRLDNARGREDADVRSVMSWGTGDCLAEVEFSRLEANNERRRYRARWSCHRARHRGEGALQKPSRSLETLDEDGEWRLLYSGVKINDAGRAFAEVLGNFGVRDFQRSMLLAQGQFDALLDADRGERAAILERLTQTTSYKDLGARAARIRAAFKARLDALVVARDEVGAVAPDEMLRREQAERDLRAGWDARKTALAALEARRRWVEERDRAEADITKARETVRALGGEREAAADELGALANHERCAAGFTALDDRRVATESVASGQRDVEALTRDLRTRQEAEGRAAEAFEAAAKRLEEARRLLEALRGVAEAEGRAREAFDAAEHERARVEKSVVVAEQAREAAAAEERSAAEAVGVAASAVVDAEGACAASAHLQALTAQWDELRGRLDELVGRREWAESERRRLAAEAERWTRAGEGIAQQRGALERFRTERVEPAERAFGTAQRELDALLQGESFEHRRTAVYEELSAVETQLSALRDADRALVAFGEARAEQDRRAKAAHDSVQRSETARALVERDALALGQAERGVQEAREALDGVRIVAAVSEHRAQLSPGKPCPLCGAVDHPWVDDPTRAVDDARVAEAVASARKRLAERAAEAEAAREALAQARGERARSEEAAEQTARELARAGEALAVASGEARGALAKAALSPESDVLACRAAYEEAARRWEGIDGQRKALESARQRWEERREAFESRQKAADERTRAVEQAEVAQRTQGESLAAARRRHEELVEALGAESAALRAKLETHSVVIRSESPRDWRAAAAEDVARWQGLVSAVEKAQAALPLARQRQASAKVTLGDRGDALASARKELAQRQETSREARQTLSRARDALLAVWREAGASDSSGDAGMRPSDDAPASSFVASQTTATGLFARRAETTRAALDETREGLGKTRGRLVQRREDLAKARVELVAREVKLQETVTALGLSGVDQLVAQRIPLERYDVLCERRRGLERREREARATLAERQRVREEIRGRRPPELDDGVSVEALDGAISEARVALEEARSAHEEAWGHLERVRDQEKRGREAVIALERERERADVWLRLHELIGVNGGQRFQEFAQSLNLDRLIRQANRHLERLAPRYRLAQVKREGLPTLEFSVIDLWHVSGERAARGLSGHERSPRTLSGGERFLVSLALALGLSDLRTHSLPIETLLLDEGFGTLDSRSLDTALDALQRLQLDGRQVGIISHVAALRERIPAQVVVEALEGGRSRLTIG